MYLDIMSVNVVIEVIGYVASAFVLFSFLLKDIKWIRIVNIVGAVSFVLYGFLTKTYPTAFMNVALVLVHIYYLIKMYIESKKQKTIEEKE